MRVSVLPLRQVCLLFCLGAAVACGGGGTGVDNRTSAVRLAFSTGGNDLDVDGYQVTVGKNLPVTVGTNSVQVVGNLTGRNVTVGVAGVAANCSIVGNNPVTVTLTPGDTSDVIFTVACISTRGIIRLINTTSGQDLPIFGYLITLDDSLLGFMRPNTAVEIDNVAKGQHLVGTFIADNCTVTPTDTTRINIAGGDTATINFSAACAALPSQLGFPFTDPAGDTLGNLPSLAPKAIDFVSMAGDYTASGLVLTLHFSGAVQPYDAAATNSVSGWIELDLDESLATGDTALVNYYIQPINVPLGSDEYISFFDVKAGHTFVYYSGSVTDSTQVTATFDGDSVVIVMPDSALRDDGNFRFDLVVGNTGLNARPTDFAPNLGYYTARKPPLALLSLAAPIEALRPQPSSAARRAAFLRRRGWDRWLGSYSVPAGAPLPLRNGQAAALSGLQPLSGRVRLP